MHLAWVVSRAANFANNFDASALIFATAFCVATLTFFASAAAFVSASALDKDGDD